MGGCSAQETSSPDDAAVAADETTVDRIVGLWRLDRMEATTESGETISMEPPGSIRGFYAEGGLYCAAIDDSSDAPAVRYPFLFAPYRIEGTEVAVRLPFADEWNYYADIRDGRLSQERISPDMPESARRARYEDLVRATVRFRRVNSCDDAEAGLRLRVAAWASSIGRPPFLEAKPSNDESETIERIRNLDRPLFGTEGPTLLEYAIELPHADDVVEALLVRGADPNARSGDEAPLDRALRRENASAIDLLLAYGADPFDDSRGLSVMQRILRDDDVASLRTLAANETFANSRADRFREALSAHLTEEMHAASFAAWAKDYRYGRTESAIDTKTRTIERAEVFVRDGRFVRRVALDDATARDFDALAGDIIPQIVAPRVKAPSEPVTYATVMKEKEASPDYPAAQIASMLFRFAERADGAESFLSPKEATLMRGARLVCDRELMKELNEHEDAEEYAPLFAAPLARSAIEPASAPTKPTAGKSRSSALEQTIAFCGYLDRPRNDFDAEVARRVILRRIAELELVGAALVEPRAKTDAAMRRVQLLAIRLLRLDGPSEETKRDRDEIERRKLVATDQGIGDYLNSRKGARFETWLHDAEQGEPTAQWIYGHCRLLGIGPGSHKDSSDLPKRIGADEVALKLVPKHRFVRTNFESTSDWFRRSAEQGFVPAQHDLGRLLLDDTNPKNDPSEGLRWVRFASCEDYAAARRSLGRAYEQGKAGLSIDMQRAQEEFEAAAEKGSAAAVCDLARGYETGRGGERDDEAMFATYLKSATAGYPYAQRKVGYFYLHPDRVPSLAESRATNAQNGVDWYVRAMKAGDVTAISDLATMMLRGGYADRTSRRFACFASPPHAATKRPDIRSPRGRTAGSGKRRISFEWKKSTFGTSTANKEGRDVVASFSQSVHLAE